MKSQLANLLRKQKYSNKSDNIYDHLKITFTYMKKYKRIAHFSLVVFLSSLTLLSCKSKAVLASGTASNSLSSDKIIEKHYDTKVNFSTVYIKSSAHYEDGKQSQNVTAEIKIKKDELILISIRFLGITMAKALITPSEVKYYEKIGGKFFDGNYSILSKLVGTDLDYQKVQNMLIGEALDNLKELKYTTSIEDKWYKLENNSDSNTKKTYYFEAENFLIKKQEIAQYSQERMVKISYPSHSEFNSIVFPIGLVIDAHQKSEKTNITIDYNTVSFNEELSFPYSVPEGYQRIFIN